MNSTMARTYIIIVFALFLALPLLLLTIMYTAIIMALAVSPILGGSTYNGGVGNSASSSKNASLNSLNHPSRHISRMDSESHTNNNSRAMSSRRQVVRMMVAVMALYFVCLLPMRCFQLWVTFGPKHQLINLGFEGFLNVAYCLRILMYMNSAGNPIIYGLLSTNFRSAFRKSIRCCGTRMDGYRYNTAYYNSHKSGRSFGATQTDIGGTPVRNTQISFASPKNDRKSSHVNIIRTNTLSNEEMFPLTERVNNSQEPDLKYNGSQDTKSSPKDVVVNQNYHGLKSEVFSKNNHDRQTGNVFI